MFQIFAPKEKVEENAKTKRFHTKSVLQIYILKIFTKKLQNKMSSQNFKNNIPDLQF